MNNLSSASTFSLASDGGSQFKGHLNTTVCALNLLPKCNQSLPARCSLGRAFLLLLLALIGVATSTAQTSTTSGSLEGTISDTSGGRIPGVKVILRQIETNQTRTVNTDDQGFFRATDLLVSTYEVRVGDSRFAPYLHTGVVLDVGTTVHLEIGRAHV